MREMVGGCCVCSDEQGWNENPLVYCDGHGCTVAVHQGMLSFFSSEATLQLQMFVCMSVRFIMHKWDFFLSYFNKFQTFYIIKIITM